MKTLLSILILITMIGCNEEIPEPQSAIVIYNNGERDTIPEITKISQGLGDYRLFDTRRPTNRGSGKDYTLIGTFDQEDIMGVYLVNDSGIIKLEIDTLCFSNNKEIICKRIVYYSDRKLGPDSIQALYPPFE